MLKNNSFYKEYLSFNGEEAQSYKDKYIRNTLIKDYLYKFISFDQDEILNDKKLNLLQNDMIWASHYKYFEDPTELNVRFNKFKVSRKTGRSLENIKVLFDTMREIYDVCCFTYEANKYMWDNYGNNSEGFCICFEIIDTDKIFPVEYVHKRKINLTNSIIKSIRDSESRKNSFSTSAKEVSLLPLVLKDINYCEEKEIRLLFSPFDDGDGKFGGLVYPNVKDEYQHKGSPIGYNYCNLKAIKIIIGDNCKQEYKKQLLTIAEDKELQVEK